MVVNTQMQDTETGGRECSDEAIYCGADTESRAEGGSMVRRTRGGGVQSEREVKGWRR